jgi:acyl-coenzyme A synthetase/AMP-(fatty) acid ligase
MNAAVRFEDPAIHLVYYFALLKMGVCQLTLNPKDPITLQKKHLNLTNIDFVIQDIPIDDKLMESTLYICQQDKQLALSFELNTNNQSEISINDENAEVIVGSGTTGEPKVFFLTSSLLADRYKRAISASIFNRGERHYMYSELYYLDPRELSIISLFQGVSLLLPKSKPKCIITYCLENKVDHLELTANQALILLSQEKKLEKKTTLHLPHLKSLMLTSSLISQSIREKIIKKITKKLYINYATNEFGLISIATPEDIILNPGTVGKIQANIDLRIVDNDGNECKIGEVGNIRINHKPILSSYLNNEEDTKKIFRKDGYYPGDLGKLTEDGNLIYEGRKDDMMIYSGANIYPRELETILESHPNVTQSAVFPMTINEQEGIPFAVVVVNKPTKEIELLQWCHEKLGWKRPKKIFFKKELPKNRLGKVVKKKLQEEVVSILKKYTLK